MSAAVKAKLETVFPRLQGTTYTITSPQTMDYNCIAHAASDSTKFWWPLSHPRYYWPPGFLLDDSVINFIDTFRRFLGYEVCSDGQLEAGYSKIAIYAIGGSTKHMARQLGDGSWTSKLGPQHDISHELTALEGQHYGIVVQFMRRLATT
jgi:hypothetical protein